MNFVFDIDGTLSFDGKTIHLDIIDALEQLDKDNHLIFASARPLRDLIPMIPETLQNSTMIGGNGSFIKHDDLTIIEEIKDETLETILSLILVNDYDYMIDSDWDYSYKGKTTTNIFNNISKVSAKNLPLESLNTVSKIVIFDPDASVIDQLKTLDVELIFHSHENIVDISSRGCSKDKALEKINITDYIAFGNDANDIGMFKSAKTSYCIGESEYSRHATHTLNKEEIVDTLRSYL